MKKLIYLDVAASLDSIRPAERNIFLNYLPAKGYYVFVLLRGQVKYNENKNVVQIGCYSKTKLGFYKNIYKSLNKLLRQHEIKFIVVRNNVWLGLIVLFSKNVMGMRRIFIRAFPNEMLRIYNAENYFIIRRILSKFKNNILLLLIRNVIRKFDLIFARSDMYARDLSLRINRTVYPLPMGFDTNWIIDKNKRQILSSELNPNNAKIIGYLGSIDPGRNIDFILNIFNNIFDLIEFPLIGLIVSNGTLKQNNEVRNKISELGISNKLKVIGPYPYIEIANILSIMTVTVSPIPPIAPYLVSSPTKAVESIGLGIPVVGNGEIKDQSYVIKESGCGELVDYEINSFIEGIKTVLKTQNRYKMTAKGKDFIFCHRSYEVITDYFIKILSDVQ